MHSSASRRILLLLLLFDRSLPFFHMSKPIPSPEKNKVAVSTAERCLQGDDIADQRCGLWAWLSADMSSASKNDFAMHDDIISIST